VPDFEHENLGDCDQDYAYRNETLQEIMCGFVRTYPKIPVSKIEKTEEGIFWALIFGVG
jgi:hypothetical protein